MDVGSQNSIRELDHCVAEIDDRMAGQGFDVAPLRISSRWEDLKAAKAIEKDSDAAKVGVFPQCDASVIDGLWWGFDEADLVSTRAVQSVQTRECLLRQTEMFVQEFQHQRHDRMGRNNKGLQQRPTLGDDIGCRPRVRDAENIVFRDLF